MAVKPIPEGYHTVTPYLVVQDVAKLIDFVKQTFNAQEVERMTDPDGNIMHAEVRIGDSIIMMGQARGEYKPMSGMLYLYVEDVDTVYKRALQAGATSVRQPTDEFYGDRAGGVEYPAGNQWWIATHKEDISREEMMKRAAARAKQQSQS